MVNKATEIYNICINLKPSILCLTETWLDESTKLTQNYIPDGYKYIRKDRTEQFKRHLTVVVTYILTTIIVTWSSPCAAALCTHSLKH